MNVRSDQHYLLGLGTFAEEMVTSKRASSFSIDVRCQCPWLAEMKVCVLATQRGLCTKDPPE